MDCYCTRFKCFKDEVIVKIIFNVLILFYRICICNNVSIGIMNLHPQTQALSGRFKSLLINYCEFSNNKFFLITFNK